MGAFELSFAVMAGLTISGISGSLMELAAGRPPSFSEPFFTVNRPLVSVVSAALAGPLMLGNDALSAVRHGRISRTYLGFCAMTALVWAGALGSAAVGLAVWAFGHLS